MTLRLTLICHASTSALRAARFSRDEPADASGRRKAAALAGGLARPERCFASPALRARQTAGYLGLDCAIEPALRDCDHGRWAGSTLDEISAREPDAATRWLTDPAAAPHGGESIAAVLRRIAAWLEGLPDGRGRTLAVTHPAVIRAAAVHALGAKVGAFWRIDIGPLSQTALSRNGGQWRLHAINAHMAPDDRT